MKVVQRFAATCLALVGVAACSSDEPGESDWAIVKVEVVDGPALTAICFELECREFDADGDVRSGEYSAFVDAGTAFEVLRVGEAPGSGASGGSPVGGCMLLELSTDAASFTAGCGVATDNT